MTVVVSEVITEGSAVERGWDEEVVPIERALAELESTDDKRNNGQRA